ncbi:MAG: NADH-quinone oxidoreductase subunit M [Bacteroidetes bacterium]|nr:MAG: NADH-quinone oxidoreductase subunit M [Bacteroidota bacterium]
MITLLLILFPILAGLLVLVSGNALAKKIAFSASIIELAISAFALSQFRINDTAQFMCNAPWIPSLGIHFKVAMDGISILLVLLTTVLVPLIILSRPSPTLPEGKGALSPSGRVGEGSFYFMVLFMQSALIGVFTSMDGFLFYIFWELALIPIWFICLLWGGEDRARITFKFFAYTLAGSLLMLVALVYVYLQTPLSLGEGPGVRSFDIQSLYEAGASLSSAEQTWIFWALFIAFAIKMPVFPFHTWQPDTYTNAPTQGTMLLSGIMLKMGTYGLIRWLLPMAPLGVQEWGNTAMILSIVGILYASVIAIMQKDFKRLIAYSSIAHVGLISAGIFSLTVQGLQGGMMQMLAHGINVVGLFFVVDILFNRTNTSEIPKLGGIRNITPWFATLFMVVLLGSVALPLTNGFVGEFLLLNGIYQYDAGMAAFAGLTVILGAVYMFRGYQKIMLGETNSLTSAFTDLTFNEKAVLIPIVILIIAMGVYPKPVLDIAEPAVMRILNIIHP